MAVRGVSLAHFTSNRAHLLLLRTQRAVCLPRRSCLRRSESPRDGEFTQTGGNDDVQEALLEQLRLQLQNEAFKEEVKDDLKGRVERLREIEAELKQQLDETLNIEKFRMDLESGQALSDAMDQFNQLEEEIQRFKEKMKADQDEFSTWEKESTAARNKGLFFKSLYQTDENTDAEDKEGSPGSSSSSRRSRVPADPEEAQKLIAASAAVTSSAEEEVGSPFRMYLFTYMAAVLFIVAGQDLVSQEPSLALDGLYGVLGILLGVNAWNERAALAAAVEARHQRIQAAGNYPEQQQQAASVRPNSSENIGTSFDG